MRGDYHIFGAREWRNLDEFPALYHYHGSLAFADYARFGGKTLMEQHLMKKCFLYCDESYWPDVTKPAGSLIVPAVWRETLGPLFGGHLVEFYLARTIPWFSFPRQSRARNVTFASVANGTVNKAHTKDMPYLYKSIKGDGPSWLDDPTSVGFRRHAAHLRVETHPIDLLCGYPKELLGITNMNELVSHIKEWDYQEVVDSQGLVNAYSHYVATPAVFDLSRRT